MELSSVLVSGFGFLGISALIFFPLEMLYPAHQPARIQIKDLFYFWFYPSLGLWLAGLLLTLVVAQIHTVFPSQVFSSIHSLPFVIQAAAIIFLGDVWFYFLHRLCHENKFMWRFHRMHHSIRDMSWTATFRAHPVDFLLVIFGTNLPAILIGFDFKAILVFIVFQRLHTVWLHSNIKCDFGWWNIFIISPDYHRAHHMAGKQNHNYASIFGLLDILGGTMVRSIPAHSSKAIPVSGQP